LPAHQAVAAKHFESAFSFNHNNFRMEEDSKVLICDLTNQEVARYNGFIDR
jgi:hypothetical protein